MTKTMLKFSPRHALAFVVLLTIECLIAAFLHDRIIRPYIGDVLVVILLYCGVKMLFDWPAKTVALGVLLLAFAIEFLQYLQLLSALGWEHSRAAKIILGSSFSWTDMGCYVLGTAITLVFETKTGRCKN